MTLRYNFFDFKIIILGMKRNEALIILGSSSPRRKELIKNLNINYKILAPKIDERILDDYFYLSKEKIDIKEYPLKEAILKASSILSSYTLKENEILLTLDTAIIFKNKIYNKPKDLNDAFLTLKSFSNNVHLCVSGYQLISLNKIINKIVTTKVYFNDLTDSLINEYILKINVLDKAGSYAIQEDSSFKLINKIEGSYYNVIGFPLEEIKKDLEVFFNE